MSLLNFMSSLLGDFRRSRPIHTLSLDTFADDVLNSATSRVFAYTAVGKIVPVIARTMALQEANDALRLLAEGGHGKIVLVP